MMANQKLKFAKMQALGNDFMVVDATVQSIHFTSEQIRDWSNRRFGVGFDQLLMIEPARDSQCDFFYRIFNADGTEVNQCGNGARCIATYIHQHFPNAKKNLTFATRDRIINTIMQENGWIKVDMGKPIFSPDKIPFHAQDQKIIYCIECGNGQKYSCFVVGMGNPHAIVMTNSSQQAQELVYSAGMQISTHPLFPQGCNVGFMVIENRNKIRLWVYERGVGPTPACGSNACAAVVAGIHCEKLNHAVQVCQPGGELFVEWEGNSRPIFQLGPASYVYRGEISL